MARKFDFASPGVQLNEIDQSQVSVQTTEDGILLIGTSLKGPAMKPVKVKDMDSFIEIFGAPQAGKPGNTADVWRDGNRYGPTYAAYAAQAHLAARTSPVTFIRLLGENDPSSDTSDTQAGWNLGGGVSDTTGGGSTLAYGLFIMPEAAADGQATGSLAAVIYTTGSSATLSGTIAGGATVTSSVAQLIESQGTGQAATFKLNIWSDSATNEEYTFHFDPTNREGYIRNVLNTNPQKVNATNFSSTENYFLGETFEQSVKQYVTDISGNAGQQYGILLPLVSGSTHYLNNIREATAAKSGWIINRNPDPQGAGSWSPSDATKLFRIVSLHEGEWIQENYAIKIHDLKLGTNTLPDSSFAISVVDKAGNEIENFYNLTLNEASENFILKKIGDEDREWDNTNKVFNITGDYPNQSNYIRIEMSDAWKQGLTDSYALPFGFYGPSRIKGFTLADNSQGPQVFGDAVNTGTAATATFTIVAGTTSGLVATGATITFTAGGLDYVVTVNALAGTDPTFDSLREAEIDNTVDADENAFATALATLINSISGYTATDNGSGEITVTADSVGPVHDFTIVHTGDTGDNIPDVTPTSGTDTDDFIHAWVKGNDYAFKSAGNSNKFAHLPTDMSCSFVFPELRLTAENSKAGGNYDATDLFGVRHVYGNTNSSNKLVYKSGDFSDLINPLPGGLNIHSTGNSTETSFIFSLDRMLTSSATNLWYWDEDTTTSHTKHNGTSDLIKKGVKQFNVPLFGGFDGLDIAKVDPFSSQVSLTGTNKENYAVYTMDKAIEIAADPESIRYDVISIPGLTKTGLQNKLIRKVEERGDALVVVDFQDDYKASFENAGSATGGDVTSTIATAESRDLNTSYAAAYAPRLKLRDTLSGNDEILIVPSSVGAIGAMAFSEANSDGPWFAPAGFNRGGLSSLGGSNGPKVVGTLKTLSKKQRDELYQNNVNPIARFPAVGEIVVFGQKTLQQTPSALDRINVRRLMIYLKKKVGLISDTILFDQNVQATWNRFISQVDPLLSNVKTRFGITDYKLILDSSTTTDDLVDRNIMYAKVFVKPARAIEYIVIDFVVTRTGVEF